MSKQSREHALRSLLVFVLDELNELDGVSLSSGTFYAALSDLIEAKFSNWQADLGGAVHAARLIFDFAELGRLPLRVRVPEIARQGE